jgi:O-antigen/teichoic acid export membrane protein
MHSVRSATDKMAAALRSLSTDPLMRNAGWLWVNMGVASILGFVVWIIAARLYPPRQVGAVAATVAVANLIMVATALGLTETTIRHLQGVENQRRFVTRNCLLVAGSGLVGGVVWWGIAHHLLVAEGVNPWVELGMLCVCSAAAAVNSITDGAIIASRRPILLLFENTAGGLVKLSVIVFVSLGAFGLFLSWSLATVVLAVVSLVVVFRVLDLRSTGSASIPRAHTFAASNWISGMASLVTPGLTPLLVASSQGTKAATWVAIPLLTVPLLTAIPALMSRSLFAEASKARSDLRALTWRALPRSLLLTALSSGIVFLAAPFVLRLFGPQYEAHSTTLLRLLALASLISVPNFLADTVLNVRRDVVGFAWANILGNAVCLAAVIMVIPGSPDAIGWAWVVGQASYGFISCAIVLLRRHHRDTFASMVPTGTIGK